MEFLLLFILAGIGITNLVVNASILDNPRDFIINRSNILGKLLTCMMCSGFWVGLLIGLCIGINPILAGASISLLSFTFGMLVEYVEIETAVKASYLEDVEDVEDDE